MIILILDTAYNLTFLYFKKSSEWKDKSTSGFNISSFVNGYWIYMKNELIKNCFQR